MSDGILYFDQEKVELTIFSRGNLGKVVWKKNEKDESIDFEEITQRLSETDELILIGESKMNLEFRRWLLAHNRRIARKLIATLPGRSLTSELIDAYRTKYFESGSTR